jgi:hypothetical protein
MSDDTELRTLCAELTGRVERLERLLADVLTLHEIVLGAPPESPVGRAVTGWRRESARQNRHLRAVD